MDVELTLKNYRCFLDTHPARFRVRPGITAFVGVNNAGKSSLLKFLYEFRSLFTSMGPGSEFIAQSLVRPVQIAPRDILDSTEIYSNRTDRPLAIEFHAHEILQQPGIADANHMVLTSVKPTSAYTTSIKTGAGILYNVEPQNLVSWATQTVLRRPGKPDVSVRSFCDRLPTLSRTMYIGPFRNALNMPAQTAYYDINIGTPFIQTWRNYKSGANKDANLAALKITDDIRRIFEYNTLEINAASSDQTLQVIVNGRPYMLQELGSGLAQFIIVLVNVAVSRPAYILIDEPELGLHPSLQIDFLTTLASYASEGVLLATHNLGLAHAGADWVYSVRRHAEGESEVSPYEATPRFAEFLGEMSFAGYRELGYNQVLLVEGRTEIKLFQQLLRRYGRAHTVVLLPLAGATLINGAAGPALEEIKRLTANVAAVIDSERDRADGPLSPERQAFVGLCRDHGVRCHVLQRRAVEHYMADNAVKAAKGEKYRALKPFEDRRTVHPMWSREENWRIARDLSKDYLDSTDLGAFLASL